jgi:hypothetical protein
MTLDKTSMPPTWLPNTHVRFNYADFGLEQAVGAIKARVQEQGGTVAPLTALKRAELSQKEPQYLKEREKLRSPAGREIVGQNTLELFKAIKALCIKINEDGNLSIQVESDTRQCHLRNNCISLLVRLTELMSLGESPDSIFQLAILEFDKRLSFRTEQFVYPDKPERLSESTFLPDLNRARSFGWVEDEQPARFLSADALANTIVGRFVELAARADRGELRVSIDLLEY